MSNFLISRAGYYYCEKCILQNKIIGGVPLYKRKPKDQEEWPEHIKWIPLCKTHSKDYELFEIIKPKQ